MITTDKVYMKPLNQKGISIIEVLIATGIMAIVMAGFSSMLLNQNKETRAVSEILSAQDLQKTIIAVMAKGDVCQYILAPKTFNAQAVIAGTIQEIDMGVQPIYGSMVTSATPGVAIIKKGDRASGFTSSLIVESIKFIIDSGNYVGINGSFNGRWVIDFDGTKSVRKLRPVSVAAVIYADTSIPTAAKPVSCLGSGSAGSGDANYLAKWQTDVGLSESVIYENPTTGNIGIGTNTPINRLSVNGVLSSNKIQVVDVVAVSTACSPDGLIARDTNGQLLSCQSSIWKNANSAVSRLNSGNLVSSLSSAVGLASAISCSSGDGGLPASCVGTPGSITSLAMNANATALTFTKTGYLSFGGLPSGTYTFTRSGATNNYCGAYAAYGCITVGIDGWNLNFVEGNGRTTTASGLWSN